jgi:hypothetical protein
MDSQRGNRIRSRLPGRGSLPNGDRAPTGGGDRTSRFQAASYSVLTDDFHRWELIIITSGRPGCLRFKCCSRHDLQPVDRLPVHELSAVNGHSLRFKYSATLRISDEVAGPHPRHAFHRVASRAGPSSQSGILRNGEKARSAGLFCPTISRLLTRMGSRGTGDSQSP